MELEKFFQIGQPAAEVFPVLAARFAEGRQFFQLLPADRGLDVERLQVIAEVRVNVFVVVAFGQFAELPAETFAAGVVLAAGAPAIAAPIAETFHQHFELHVAHDVDRAAFAQGEMMRRIKRLRGKIAEGAGEFVVRQVTCSEPSASQLSSMSQRSCSRQNSVTASRSKGLPSVCAIITALVLPGDERFFETIESALA